MHKKIIVLLVAVVFSLDANAFTRRSKNMSMDGGDDAATDARGDAPSGTCNNVPAHAMKAYEKAKDFSESCGAAKLASGKMIAISDYSARTPMMYVFTQSGRCVESMKIDWGRGPGANKSGDRTITSCSSGGSYRVPAGMHKTTFHDGKAWPQQVSMGLAGLSGQNSYSRAVLIHPSRAGNNAGGAYSIGCTGVPQNKFRNLKRMLGYGSLVYNYFGESGRKGAGCGNNTGQKVTCGPAERVTGAGSRSGMSVEAPRSESSGDSSGSGGEGSKSRGRGGAQ